MQKHTFVFTTKRPCTHRTVTGFTGFLQLFDLRGKFFFGILRHCERGSIVLSVLAPFLEQGFAQRLSLGQRLFYCCQLFLRL